VKRPCGDFAEESLGGEEVTVHGRHQFVKRDFGNRAVEARQALRRHLSAIAAKADWWSALNYF
jgi:hypothetical protein